MRKLRQLRSLLRLAAREVLSSKRRSALIALLVLVPVTFLATFMTLEASSYHDYKNDQQRQLGGTNLAVYGIGQTTNAITQDGNWNWANQADEFGQPTRPASLSGSPLSSLPGVQRSFVVDSVSFLVRGTTVSYAQFLVHDTARSARDEGIQLRSGRLPLDASEVVMPRSVLEQLGVSVGDNVSMGGSGQVLRVVGESLSSQRNDLYSGAIGGVPDGITAVPTQWRAFNVGPLTWSTVQQLNAAGYLVLARQFVEAPPSEEEAPLSSGEAPPATSTEAGAIILALLGAALIVALAGTGFAVTAQRRAQRMALLVTAGGGRATVRGVILGQGLLLGFGASVVGVVVGALLAFPARGPYEQFTKLGFSGIHPDFVALAILLGIGTVATTFATIVPAVRLGNLNAALVLAGRPVAERRRSLVLGSMVGLLASAVGAAGMATAAQQNDFTGLAFFAVAFLLGSLLLLPLFIRLIPGTKRGPLALRIALRDAKQHRGRSAAAGAGIAIGVTAVVIAGFILQINSTRNKADYVPTAFPNQLLFPLDGQGKSPEQFAQVVSNAESEMREVFPGAQFSVHEQVARSTCAVNGPDECGDWLTLRPPTDTPCEYNSAMVQGGSPWREIRECVWGSNWSVIYRGDADALRATYGSVNEGALQALKEGKAVVTDPLALQGDGSIEVVTGADGQGVTNLPAYLLSGSLSGRPVAFLSDATVQRIGAVIPNGRQLVVDAAQPVTKAQLAEAQRRADQATNNFIFIDRGPSPSSTTAGWALPAVAALFALIATLSVLGLTLGEQAPTLAAMGAVGVTARYRRIIAAAGSFVLATLGTVWGVVVGFVIGASFVYIAGWQRVLGPEYERHTALPWSSVIPWPTLIIVIVAVPLLSAAAAFVLTRSRLEVSHRE